MRRTALRDGARVGPGDGLTGGGRTDWLGGQMEATRFTAPGANETHALSPHHSPRGRITDAPKSGMNCQRRQIRY